MEVADLRYWNFEPKPIEGCDIQCPECKAWSSHRAWTETEVGCEDCGDHAAIACPQCSHPVDHVHSPTLATRLPEGPFNVLPPDGELTASAVGIDIEIPQGLIYADCTDPLEGAVVVTYLDAPVEPAEFEAACREWAKGCTCAMPPKQDECAECTAAFLAHVKKLCSAPRRQ